MEEYEEDDLFKDLYGDEEAEQKQSNYTEVEKDMLKQSKGFLDENRDIACSNFVKVSSEPADLLCNTNEKMSASLSVQDKNVLESSEENKESSSSLNVEKKVESAKFNDSLLATSEQSKSAEQTHLDVTGSTIREDGYVKAHEIRKYKKNTDSVFHRKMFIGGLNWETTDESLRAYFEQFGEVTECNVMRDSSTGRSRGFGFLTFKDPKCVNTVMVKEHYLDGKIIDPKRAIPREEQEKTAKMFVGGVSQDCTEEEFKEFFSAFGRVIDATLMIDKDTGRPRGFGFVTFESDAAVENAMAQPYLAIRDKQIEVKRATPKGNIKERMNITKEKDMSGCNYQRNFYNKNNDGFNFPMDPQMMQQFYGGMSPAIIAQYYQRMQAYMAAMQTMGRGMQIPAGMNIGRGMMPTMQTMPAIQAMPAIPSMAGMPIMPGFPMNMGPMNSIMNQMNGMMGTMGNFNDANLSAPSGQTQEEESSCIPGNNSNTEPLKETHQKDIQKNESKTSSNMTTEPSSNLPPQSTPPPNAPTGPSKPTVSSRSHRMGYSRSGRGHGFHPYQRRN
ncbi:hypothetical protein PORY_000592 [Pneumocystis oryctolagi]|uniref:Uncharacterized protein n=1 Tax=Pneumocystis oryctolagi TaxID=42067 RepID=A0ACB7CGF2_9ASCO|nr:hypothetical protein PORY_000592 [Pneumocystis oryctolagi]